MSSWRISLQVNAIRPVPAKGWSAWAVNASPSGSDALTTSLRTVLANDLDTPGALLAIDETITSGATAGAADLAAIDALLGIPL